MTRPGERIRAIASRLLPSEAMESVIDPIVADLQCEYGDAMTENQPWRARLTLVRSYVGLASALIRLGIRYLCDPRIGNPGSDVARTWIVSVLAFAILTFTLVLPPLLNERWWEHDPLFGALLSVTLIPQALPLSIPAGLCVGVLWAARGKIVTSRRLWTVLAIATVFTALVWVTLEWMIPEANQGYREMLASRLAGDGRTVTLERGLNELGLSRLGQRTDPAAIRHYHLLWALCFAAAPLGLLACGLAGYVRRAASAVALAIAVSISYMVCIWVSADIPSGSLIPPLVQAWTPNVVSLLIACGLILQRRRPVAI